MQENWTLFRTWLKTLISETVGFFQIRFANIHFVSGVFSNVKGNDELAGKYQIGL